MPQEVRFIQGLLVAIPSVFEDGVFINAVLQTQVGKKKIPKLRNLFNPMKNPLAKKIQVGFVGNWLLKTL